MKKYVPIIIGIVALCAVLYVGEKEMSRNDDNVAMEEQTSTVSGKTFQGQVSRFFEGTSTLSYGFDLPETATTTVEKEGAQVRVTEGGALVMAMYVSYEGGRGYTPADYIKNTIVRAVPTATTLGTTTIGAYDWFVAESANSEWHVASVNNGEWLLVVENPKVESEKATSIINTLVTSKVEAMVETVMESATETPVEATATDAMILE